MKVFWSWQSDTPGKTGRHFVRECLAAAIARLKATDELTEPTEREAREAIHLDHDRLGVSGSPDLANLIFGKIDASEVFVADVTPVSVVSSQQSADGTRRRQKRNMNPNVAIELGYALKALESESVLMVLNEHRGKREHLPFDLAHKAGPLMYRLAPDATADDIAKQRAHLTGQFVEALKPFLKRLPAPERAALHEPIAATTSPAVYFGGRSLATTENADGEAVMHFFSGSTAFYLRVLPIEKLPSRIPKSSLLSAIQQANLCSLTRSQSGGTARANEFGAIVFEDHYSSEGEIACATQVFSSGELWGFSNEFAKTRDDRAYVATGAVEKMFEFSLGEYISFARDQLQIGKQVNVIGGATGLRDFKLAIKGWGGTELRPLHGDAFTYSDTFAPDDVGMRVQFLKRLFDEMWDLAGLVRPESG